jgi:hypothetical protein
VDWIQNALNVVVHHHIYWNWMQILYQNQLLNVPQWKLISDALTLLVELSFAACCKSVLSKIRGYHKSMPMCMVFTFPGNYCIGEGNTINKSIYISSLLLDANCRLFKSLKRYGSSICSEYLLVHRCNWR